MVTVFGCNSNTRPVFICDWCKILVQFWDVSGIQIQTIAIKMNNLNSHRTINLYVPTNNHQQHHLISWNPKYSRIYLRVSWFRRLNLTTLLGILHYTVVTINFSTSSLIRPSYPWSATIIKSVSQKNFVQFNIFPCLKNFLILNCNFYYKVDKPLK